MPPGSKQLSGPVAGLPSILDGTPELVLGVGEDDLVTFSNSRLEVESRNWREILSPELHDPLETAIRTMRATGESQTLEVKVSSIGRPMSLSFHVSSLRWGAGASGALLVGRDVSDARRSHAEFLGAQRMAAVGTLAAGIAHEINTPVQFVSDSIYFLREATKDAFEVLSDLNRVRAELGQESSGVEALEALLDNIDLTYLVDNVPRAFDRCIDGLARVGKIVRSMREFAHPSNAEMVAADLNRAIENTLEVARSEYKYIAEVRVDLEEIPPVLCHVDQINQVLLNLILNAAHAIAEVVKGTDQKGLIRVSTRQEGDQVVLAVSDDGIGIPDSAKPRVFEPFFTTKEVGRGTGQGLSIAWAIVTERHAGKLTFESEIGKGSTFFVRLPIQGPAKQIRSDP
ncbi:MAG: hypothetical protein HY791_05070 [Deltaproteobacteria bacterium]|nr:hypothetical protein [Deltaproteobacteria bacterium]